MLGSETSPDLDRETIAYWVEMAEALGFARSVGEAFGLIFLADAPLSADDIVTRLGVSRSGVGQSLKTLLEIGAIRPVTGISSRKDHFELQTDLGVLVRLFLNSRVLPRLAELNRRRAQLAKCAETKGPAHVAARFEKLERWGTKTAPLTAMLHALSKT